MNWTKFKEKHLFSVNIAIVASVILWQIRRDFTWHPVILAWTLSGFFIPSMRLVEKKFLMALGKFNGILILSAFYVLIFTPFSVLYRLFFRHQSFKRKGSTFDHKETISPFNRPF